MSEYRCDGVSEKRRTKNKARRMKNTSAQVTRAQVTRAQEERQETNALRTVKRTLSL